MRRPTPKKLPLVLSALLAALAFGLRAAEAVPAGVSAPASAAAVVAPAPATVATASVILVAPTPSPTPVPVPVTGAPGVPGVPNGSFTVLTRSSQPPTPVMHLRWAAAEPGDFLIRGYRLFRSEGSSGDLTRRPVPDPGSGAVPLGLSYDDPVQIGTTYQYVVEAVDVKDHAGPRSAPFQVDLRSLPPEQIAPRPPQGLTALPARETVKLQWQAPAAWVATISSYRVFRGPVSGAVADQLLTETSGTAFEDSPPARALDFIYALQSVDIAGRTSAMSSTISARATGPLPPGSPAGLTTKAKVDKVTLTWSLAPAGTSPVTAYLLQRRPEESDAWTRVALLSASTTTQTDSVEGDRGYIYSLAAIDSEGLTGSAVYAGASPTAKVWNKTLVILMPTAYSNNKGDDRGINLDVLFDFYVGSLYESYTSPITTFTKNGLFQPLQIGTVTSDLKWSLLNDNGYFVPGLAAGLYTAALIPFGNPGGGQSVGVSSAGNGISTLGNAYAVASKRFWPTEPRAAMHIGLMYGKLADYLTSDPTPKDWRPTLRHLTPGGDVPMLLNRFVDPKQGALVSQASHMLFGGIQVPFTVPLIFTEWRTGLRLEGMLPLASTADYPPNTLITDGRPVEQLLPYMINIHVDNLPLFGFEFSYFKYDGGYQIIAFYHIPDLTWSW